jgi:hypothetical protein
MKVTKKHESKVYYKGGDKNVNVKWREGWAWKGRWQGENSPIGNSATME